MPRQGSAPRLLLAGLAALGAGVLLTVLALQIAPQLGSPVLPTVLVDRTLWVDAEGGGFSVIGESGAPHGKSFNARAARGRECLTPLAGGQPVEFGVVSAPAGKEAGAEIVVWIRCL